MKELFNLKGRTALVTGGSQGIGKGITLALAEFGANVVINFHSGVETAKQTKAEAEKLGAKVWLWQFDLAQANVKQAWLDFAEKNGCPVDIVVANASVQYRHEWFDITEDEFASQINVNLRSTLELMQAAVPHMKANGWGRILTIGSVQQARPNRYMAAYAASKSGIVNMVKNIAARVAPFGITVNNIAPGVFETARNREVLSDAAFRKDIESKIPVGFVGEPKDCAATALLLCSDAGRYITGADFFVDGGFSLFI